MRSSLVCPVRGKYTLSGLLRVTSRPATSRTSLRVAMAQGYDTEGCGQRFAIVPASGYPPGRGPANRRLRLRRARLRVEGLDPEPAFVGRDQDPGALGQGGDQLAGEAEHGRLVGWAVADGQRPVAVPEPLQHPAQGRPERGRLLVDEPGVDRP